MPSYLVTNLDVLDFEKFKEYLKVILNFQMKFGGKPIIDNSNLEIVHGKPHNVLVVVEFPDKETIDEMLNSPDLKEVEPIREAATEGWLAIVEGQNEKIEGWKI